MKSAVQFVLPTLAERRDAAARLCGVLPTIDVRDLTRAVEEGFLEMHHVALDGRNLYAVWLHQTIDGGLHVNAAVALTTHTEIDDLADGLEALARQRRLKYVQFNTERPGLVREANRLGYHAIAVCVKKQL